MPSWLPPLVLLASLICGCNPDRPNAALGDSQLPAVEQPHRDLALGEPMPEASFQQFDNTQVRSSLSSLRGRVVLMEVFASWCEGCKQTLSHLAKLQDSLRQAGLSVLYVAQNSPADSGALRSFLRDARVAVPILLPLEFDKFADEFEIAGVPRTYLLDRKGRLQYRWLGSAYAPPAQRFDLAAATVLTRLLAEPP